MLEPAGRQFRVEMILNLKTAEALALPGPRRRWRGDRVKRRRLMVRMAHPGCVTQLRPEADLASPPKIAVSRIGGHSVLADSSV